MSEDKKNSKENLEKMLEMLKNDEKTGTFTRVFVTVLAKRLEDVMWTLGELAARVDNIEKGLNDPEAHDMR